MAALDQVFQGISPPPPLKPHIWLYSNDLAIWHSFPHITDNQVNIGCNIGHSYQVLICLVSCSKKRYTILAKN